VSKVHFANIGKSFLSLKMQQKNKHELNPRVSADIVIFGFDFNQLKVLLIERENLDATEGMSQALPGDLIYENEDLYMAASRILNELTGLNNIYLEQVGAFGDPNRLNKEQDKLWLKSVRQQPDERVITVAYYSLVNLNDYVPQASSFAKSTVWIPLNEIAELAFDHSKILSKALHKLKEKIMMQPIGFNLLPEKFTFSQLHKLYESILGRELDKRNFRRKMLKLKLVESLDEKQEGVPHKPSRYFKFNEENYNRLIENGYDNFGF
jgi:8-oxo-dGTP diphosphatase